MTPEFRVFLRRIALLPLACAAALAGCSRAPALKVAPVSGRVTVDGRPLVGVKVAFAPDATAGNRGPMATGWLDRQGRYELQTIRGLKGAVPGLHQVFFLDPNVGASSDEADRTAGLHPKLLNPAASGLTAVVELNRPNAIDFSLSSGEAR